MNAIITELNWAIDACPELLCAAFASGAMLIGQLFSKK